MRKTPCSERLPFIKFYSSYIICYSLRPSTFQLNVLHSRTISGSFEAARALGLARGMERLAIQETEGVFPEVVAFNNGLGGTIGKSNAQFCACSGISRDENG
ncbi:hypothetical protein CEXT_634621 [Caerostris extrusa]|uniref:Uncharacterized protein n=1 Tax=Caerostris extrusa TaxID=172846 RepID=A0AAV4U720_CAEEX|nr:hypothetical protein CEXT_634621 [Caerostris extrusa]